MKKRELYDKLIRINDSFTMKIDDETEEIVNLYRDKELLEKFKLNRKIYTLFKVIQEYVKEDDYIIVEDNQIKIFGKEIHLYEDIYIKINADRACLTLDIFQKINEFETKLIYLTKLIYTSQKLFHMLLIPKKLENNPSYYVTNIFKFLDMIEILGYEKSDAHMNNSDKVQKNNNGDKDGKERIVSRDNPN